MDLLKGIWDGLVGFWMGLFEFTSTDDKVSWVIIKFGEGLKTVCDNLAQQEFVFVIGALIGAYFMIAGNKKVGTKITSTSFILYIILKVVTSC